MDRNNLVNEITKAFAKLTYPGDEDLTVHPLGFDEDFYESIKGKTWRQLDRELLQYHHDCIGVLTAKGFQYYIAAFLREDLTNESSLSEAMVWHFSQAVLEDSSPIVGVTGKIWFVDRVKILSIRQRSCLVSYFQFIKKNELKEYNEEVAAIEIVIEAINTV